MTDRRRLRAGLPAIVPLVMLLLATPLAGQNVGIRAPDGFEVTLYADDDLAHDIFSMTLDARGRVVVAGRDYVKTLHDDDGDGQADRATLFSEVPASGAHGMLFDGPDLICTGDNSVMRLRDVDGDGATDGEPEVWARLKHPEHGANGITRGPDGWIYVICGNDAGVSVLHAQTPGSPVKKPRTGGVVRFSPDGKTSEVFAHGFRNPYDASFNALGYLFTVDADGERDQYLPWYSPTRLFDIAPGMHHGWVLRGWKRSWNRPAEFFDSGQRLVEIGRGSPTGVIVYRHRQFPAAYRGNVLSCCWTMGRVYHFPLARRGSTYESRREIFLETTGDVGFAPVDLAIGREGDLFVAIGGRSTRGGVFRVRYVGKETENGTKPAADSLRAVLTADQPLSAWSRAAWAPAAKKLGRDAFAGAVCDAQLSTAERIRAVEVLTDLFGGVSSEVARKCVDRATEEDAELLARLVWSLGQSATSADELTALPKLLWWPDLRVRRATWEALARWPEVDREAVALSLRPDPEHFDRRVRSARILAASRWSQDNPTGIIPGKDANRTIETLRRLHLNEALGREHFRYAFDAFDTTADAGLQFEAVRLMQLCLGDVRTTLQDPDVYAGYSRGDAKELSTDELKLSGQLAAAFPTGGAALDRELARLLGMMDAADAQLLERIATKWTAESRVQDDIHYLIVLSRLGGARSTTVTQRTAAALARLHGKMAAGRMYPSRNWPLRVGEAFEQLAARDPQLAAILVADPEFRLPVQSMFVGHMPENVRIGAARKLLKAALADEDEPAWTSQFIQVIAALPPEELLPVLRDRWDDYALRDDIVLELARDPAAADRDKFIEGLASPQPEVVEQAARALGKLEGEATAEEILAAVRALRHACSAKPYVASRRALVRLLARWSGEEIVVRESLADDLLATYEPWFAWFAEAHPEANRKLSGLAGDDAQTWRRRLDSIDWDAGDASRGKVVFQRRSCHKCHLGSTRLGPELAGVTGRLSRFDLLVAITDPNKDVSPLYQSTQLVTAAGKIYHGLLVYQSPDGTLLQTAPDTTVRIAGDEILTARKSRQSIMPTGLLRDITDAELADLFAFLKSLRREE